MRKAVYALGLVLALAVPGTAAASSDPVPPTPGGPASGPASAASSAAGPGDDSARATGGAAALADGVDDESAALMRRQAPLAEAARQLDTTVGGLAGFTAIELDAAGLILRWKGGRPPSKALAAVKRAGVAVKVVSARYAKAELTRAADRIRDEVEAGRGNGVQSISIASDGSGLRLGVDGPAVDPAARALGPTGTPEPAPAQRTAVARTVQATGTTIATTVVVRPRLTQMSRENDFPPWAGGIVVVDKTPGGRYNGERCTGGFGVRSRNDNSSYLVTASHCGDLADTFTDGAGQTIGIMAYRHADQGVALIRASSISGEIYVGGGIGKAQSIRGVALWAPPYKGQALCASAAVTGNICGLVVTDTDDYMCASEPGIPVKCWKPLVRVERTNGALAGQPGDSGGPLYYLSGARAAIVGIVLGGDGGATLWIANSRKIEEAFDGIAPDDTFDLNLSIATRSY